MPLNISSFLLILFLRKTNVAVVAYLILERLNSLCKLDWHRVLLRFSPFYNEANMESLLPGNFNV